jgi:hypothetical protein
MSAEHERENCDSDALVAEVVYEGLVYADTEQDLVHELHNAIIMISCWLPQIQGSHIRNAGLTGVKRDGKCNSRGSLTIARRRIGSLLFFV